MGRPLDTSGDAFNRQVAALRSMTPAARLRLADDRPARIARLEVKNGWVGNRGMDSTTGHQAKVGFPVQLNLAGDRDVDLGRFACT